MRETLYRVLAILYRYSERIAVIEYPRRMERRSIDIAATLRGGRRVLVKVSLDAGSVPRGEVQELIALSSVLGAAPLIVARMKDGVEMVEGVAYDRHGARAVSPETLEAVLSGRDTIYIYESRDTFKVKIDPEALRRARSERGLSLGDLASMIGATRKTVYDYERGKLDPTLERAEALVKALGEEILQPVDIFSPPRGARTTGGPPSGEVEARLAALLEEAGYTVVRARRTAADMGCSSGEAGRRMIFVVDGKAPRRRASGEKITYFEQLARIVGVDEHAVVTEDPSRAKALEREGVRVLTLEEVAEHLSGLSSGGGRVLHREAGSREEYDSL